MLDDLPRNVWHIRGFPRKDVFVVAEEVNDRAFLFGGKRGTNAYHFTLGAARIYEDPLGALCFFRDPLPESGELFGGDDCHGVATSLDLALIGMMEGGANGDDPVRACHVQLEVCIVGDSHELHVAWTS